MQEVLFWQTCTLRMMFKIVGDALAEAGVQGKHPGDYLIFLTVGTCSFLIKLYRALCQKGSLFRPI